MPLVRKTVYALLLGVLVGACHGAAGAVVITQPPSMVWVAPGIWVVEDYPYTVYYTDGFYWYLRGGIWYRSPRWDYSFARVAPSRLPPRLRGLPHERYHRYHASPQARRFHPGRGDRPPSHPPPSRRGGHREHREREHRRRR